MLTNEDRFTDTITTEAQLREIIGHPGGIAARKMITELDDLCREFISQSPFLLIASSDAQGKVDLSPKGDPPGFVQVLDDTTLLIPDRPGNRRADTFVNILQNPQIGLLFLIPGRRETLRVSGRARLIRDAHLREPLAVKGKIPELLIAVNVEEVFFHCPKCIVRSALWRADLAPELADLGFLAEAMVKHGEADLPIADAVAILEDDATNGLY